MTGNGHHNTLIKKLPVALTDEELLTFAREQAGMNRKLAEVQRRKKSDAAFWASQERRVNDEIFRLCEIVHSGTEERDVECYEIGSYDLGRVYLYRADTRERVSERPMTTEERQTCLPLDEDAANETQREGETSTV